MGRSVFPCIKLHCLNITFQLVARWHLEIYAVKHSMFGYGCYGSDRDQVLHRARHVYRNIAALIGSRPGASLDDPCVASPYLFSSLTESRYKNIQQGRHWASPELKLISYYSIPRLIKPLSFSLPIPSQVRSFKKNQKNGPSIFLLSCHLTTFIFGTITKISMFLLSKATSPTT